MSTPTTAVQLLPDNPRVTPHVLARTPARAGGAHCVAYVLTDAPAAPQYDYAAAPDIACEVHVCDYADPAVRGAVARLTAGDTLFAHYLTAPVARLVRGVAAGVRVVWGVFGAEFYARPELCSQGMLLPQTAELERARAGGWRGRKRVEAAERGRPSRLARVVPSVRARTRTLREAMARVDVVATAFPAEFAMIRDAVSPRARHAEYTYYSAERAATAASPFAAAQASAKTPLRRTVLVGNNAHASNNHLEAVAMLLAAGVEPDDILLPLAYGDPDYRVALRERLPAGVRTLNAPLPLGDYLALLATCRAAVFNHRRQQAFGNVVALLRQGARVWLRPENAIGSLLDELDLPYGRLGTDPLDVATLGPLSPEQVAEALPRFETYFAEERVRALHQAALLDGEA